MGRGGCYDKTTEARVHELWEAGRSVSEVHAALLAEGRVISRPTVGRIMQRAKSGSGMAHAPLNPTSSIDLEPIKALLPKLTAMAEKAMIDDEAKEANSLLRTITQLATQIARLEPPPVHDPNEHPDMVQAAKECRKKLQEYVEKARSGK
jgi:hypothetical protein